MIFRMKNHSLMWESSDIMLRNEVPFLPSQQSHLLAQSQPLRFLLSGSMFHRPFRQGVEAGRIFFVLRELRKGLTQELVGFRRALKFTPGAGRMGGYRPARKSPAPSSGVRSTKPPGVIMSKVASGWLRKKSATVP